MKKAPKVKKIPAFQDGSISTPGAEFMMERKTPEDTIFKPQGKKGKDAKLGDYLKDAGRLALDTAAGTLGLDSLIKNDYKTQAGLNVNEAREKYVTPIAKGVTSVALNTVLPGAGSIYNAATTGLSNSLEATERERKPGESDAEYSKRMADIGIDVSDTKTGLKGYEGLLAQLGSLSMQGYQNNQLKKYPEGMAKGGDVSSGKAKEILSDGEAHGRPLTERQIGFFGLKAGNEKNEGGLIEGAGSGKSDSIRAKIKPGSFVVPEENSGIAAMLDAKYFGTKGKPANLKQGGGIDVKLSNGEYLFDPNKKRALIKKGVNIHALAPNAKDNSKLADGGGVDDKKKPEEQAQQQPQPQSQQKPVNFYDEEEYKKLKALMAQDFSGKQGSYTAPQSGEKTTTGKPLYLDESGNFISTKDTTGLLPVATYTGNETSVSKDEIEKIKKANELLSKTQDDKIKQYIQSQMGVESNDPEEIKKAQEALPEGVSALPGYNGKLKYVGDTTSIPVDELGQPIAQVSYNIDLIPKELRDNVKMETQGTEKTGDIYKQYITGYSQYTDEKGKPMLIPKYGIPSDTGASNITPRNIYKNEQGVYFMQNPDGTTKSIPYTTAEQQLRKFKTKTEEVKKLEDLLKGNVDLANVILGPVDQNSAVPDEQLASEPGLGYKHGGEVKKYANGGDVDKDKITSAQAREKVKTASALRDEANKLKKSDPKESKRLSGEADKLLSEVNQKRKKNLIQYEKNALPYYLTHNSKDEPPVDLSAYGVGKKKTEVNKSEVKKADDKVVKNTPVKKQPVKKETPVEPAKKEPVAENNGIDFQASQKERKVGNDSKFAPLNEEVKTDSKDANEARNVFVKTGSMQEITDAEKEQGRKYLKDNGIVTDESDAKIDVATGKKSFELKKPNIGLEDVLAYGQIGLGLTGLLKDGKRPTDKIDSDFNASVERSKADAMFGLDAATKSMYEKDIESARIGLVNLAANTAGGDPLLANARARAATNQYSDNLLKLASADASLRLQKRQYSDEMVSTRAGMRRSIFEDKLAAFNQNQMAGAELLGAGIDNLFTSRRNKQALESEKSADKSMQIDVDDYYNQVTSNELKKGTYLNNNLSIG